MNNTTFEAKPLAHLSAVAPNTATQWYAVHYTADADSTLPRTIFANEVEMTVTGDAVRFMVTPAGGSTYPVLEVPVSQIVRCAPYGDLRAALADAFGGDGSAAV